MKYLLYPKSDINKAIRLIATAILEEVEELEKSRRIWIKKWIKRRDLLE